MDMKKLLEAVDSMGKAEKKPTGPKFPGYWKGTDPASKSKSKMVGSAEESILKDLHNTAKQKVTEWSLEEAYRNFNEVDLGPSSPEITKLDKSEVNRQINDLAKNQLAAQQPEYKGVDPIVRQRMGMNPATQGEIQSHLDKNPAGVQTSTGEPVRSGSGQPVAAGGQVDVARAADAAAPDRAQSVAREPAVPVKAAQEPVSINPVVTQPAKVVDLPRTTPIPKPEPVITAAPAPATKPVKTAPAVPQMPENPRVGSWQELWKNNPDIKNPNLIYPGQQIKLPDDGGTYTVQKGDSLSKIAAQLRGDEPATTRSIGGKSTQAPQMQMPDYLVSQIPGVESGNNPAAVSPKGAIGSWQTMPSTLRDPGFGVTPAQDTSHAEMNRVGQDYAHAMYNRYSGDAEKALAAYNAGPGRVDQAIKTAATKGGDWKDYIPHETQAYLPKFNLTPPSQFAMKENKELARKHDVGHFARLLRSIEDREQVDEYENAQDPNAQVTSQPDPTGSKASGMDQQAAADKEQAVDVATAKGTMSGLKTVLGPKVDTNALASAVTKISDGQPLTAPEATSMSALTPLISKAAETPQTAMSLKTALSNAALLAKQGK